MLETFTYALTGSGALLGVAENPKMVSPCHFPAHLPDLLRHNDMENFSARKTLIVCLIALLSDISFCAAERGEPFGQPRFAYDKVSPSKKSIPLAARMASPLPRRRINMSDIICGHHDKSEFEIFTKDNFSDSDTLSEKDQNSCARWASRVRSGGFSG
jgi:hypothetical protein